MIVLVNFNSYLGGGETLAVRYSEYLHKNNIPFKSICLKNSFIAKDLNKRCFYEDCVVEIEEDPNYYYLSGSKRDSLINVLSSVIPNNHDTHVVSFCARDLYTIIELKKRLPSIIITHLVLHDQDNLYVCQSLFDKFYAKYFGKQRFSRKKQIEFNADLFNLVSRSGNVIPQSDLQVPLWHDEFGIDLDYSNVVALPVCDFTSLTPDIKQGGGKKIIWVGRIVDFKIPALCAMVSYVNRHKDYSLTVVGDGDMDAVMSYIHVHNISKDNIDFVGQVEYADLPAFVKSHDIGYAMGTSIIEIAKLGLPVIMALGAPQKVLFKEEICGGLYVNVSKGNVGDNLYAGESESIQPHIEETIERINSNYAWAAKECYDTIKNMFDQTVNMDAYTKIILNSKDFNVNGFSIPKASILRRLLFNRMK